MAVKDRYRIPVFPARSVPAEADVLAVQDWLMKNAMIQSRIPYADMVISGP